jgi:hypothetical protein
MPTYAKTYKVALVQRDIAWNFSFTVAKTRKPASYSISQDSVVL